MKKFNKLKGDIGESLVEGYFSRLGYKIITSNFKNMFGEIDLIARDERSEEKFICFIEVKSRSHLGLGHAMEAVDYKKQMKLRRVASSFLAKYNLVEIPVRFDVVEVYGADINHIKNAF